MTATSMVPTNGHTNGALAPLSADDLVRQNFMPVLDIDSILARQALLGKFRNQVLKVDTDYGVIPGTNGKATLLKPGAEKLCTLFGLTVQFHAESQIEDWTGTDHAGEPFFFYKYKCSLSRNGYPIAEAIGSASSWEKKYRWREGGKVCPGCGASAITRSKYPPNNAPQGTEPGWYCYAKKGGCGLNFGVNDPTITSQAGGRVPNPDIHDCVPTVDKMAQKRALIAAVLIGVGASEYFTSQSQADDSGSDISGDNESQNNANNGNGAQRASNTAPEKASPALLLDHEDARKLAVNRGMRTSKGKVPPKLADGASAQDAKRQLAAFRDYLKRNPTPPGATQINGTKPIEPQPTPSVVEGEVVESVPADEPEQSMQASPAQADDIRLNAMRTKWTREGGDLHAGYLAFEEVAREQFGAFDCDADVEAVEAAITAHVGYTVNLANVKENEWANLLGLLAPA